MRIEVVPGDITVQDVDVVVNAANAGLLGGGGVDGAIHAAAGPALLEECRRVRKPLMPQGLPVGEVVVTGAGQLRARWVVHTVGPNRNRGQNDPALLTACYRNSLLAAAGLGARSVAFPAVSAGAYGWDVVEVARIAVAAVRSVEVEGGRPAGAGVGAGSVDLVRFVPFGATATAAFVAALAGA